MSIERLQKILAQAGLASRRQAETLISDGLVTVNGKVAQLGDKAELGKDSIKVKGKLLRQPESLVYMAFHKPKGVISMLSDPQLRPTLANYLSQVKTRVYPIGRLDFNSEGLILLTNDGELAQKIQKNENLVRVYWVKVKGHPDAEMLARIERGTRQTGSEKAFKPHSLRIRQKLPNKTIIEIVLIGGKAYDLKGLFDTRGFLVERIIRTAIGQITLKDIQPGEFRYLKATQLTALVEQPELGLKRLEQETPVRVKVREQMERDRPKKTVRIRPVSQTASSRPKKFSSTEVTTRSPRKVISPKNRVRS